MHDYILLLLDARRYPKTHQYHQQVLRHHHNYNNHHNHQKICRQMPCLLLSNRQLFHNLVHTYIPKVQRMDPMQYHNQAQSCYRLCDPNWTHQYPTWYPNVQCSNYTIFHLHFLLVDVDVTFEIIPIFLFLLHLELHQSFLYLHVKFSHGLNTN